MIRTLHLERLVGPQLHSVHGMTNNHPQRLVSSTSIHRPLMRTSIFTSLADSCDVG